MKKLMVLVMFIVLSTSFLLAAPIELETHGEAFEEETYLNLFWNYKPDVFYRFKFSDLFFSKDSNFEGVFESDSLEHISMSTLKANRLWNDKKIYVYWQVDPMSPIAKMTLEMPQPLIHDGIDVLDWYTSIDNGKVIGGQNGYGVANSVTVFERDSYDKNHDVKDSVQLNMWTDDITGKKAGDYTGYLVLRVFGEI